MSKIFLFYFWYLPIIENESRAFKILRIQKRTEENLKFFNVW